MLHVFIHRGPKVHLPQIKGFCKAAFLCLIFISLSCLFYHSAYSQTASFTAESATGNFCAPASIQFKPTFSENPVGYFWQSGSNNEESESASPTFTYLNPGVYKAVLYVLFNTSILEVEKTITVYGSPSLTISASKTSICKPEDISFSLQSDAGLSDITWDFGDGATQPGDGNNKTAGHYFDRFQHYNVQVTATSLTGCIGVAGIGVSLQKPTAELSAIPVGGCIPVEVAFAANISMPHGNIVTSYTWDFDDGSPAVSGNSSSLNHTYTNVDSFNAKVSIVTAEGCTNTFSFPIIAAGAAPNQTRISVDTVIICASERVLFTELSGAGTKYFWEISNGAKSETGIPELSFKFNNLGKFMVKVTPENNGCIGVSDSIEMEIKGVIANYTYNNTCANKSLFSFRNTSVGKISQIRWDMGDGSFGETTSRVDHQFAQSGEFPVKLFVSDNITGCSDSLTINIYTAVPVLVPADTFFCKNMSVTLGVRETYTNPRTLYIWQIAGRPVNNTSDSFATTTANNYGLFTNRVIINNGTGYCRDTLTQNSLTRVGGPIASFNTPSFICFKDSFWVNDLSTQAFATDTIKQWIWKLQNGGEVTAQNPGSIPYTSTGFNRVKLVVMDNKGCTDSTNKATQIRRLPLLWVIPGNQKICEAQDFALTALGFTPVNWNPGNEVSCPTCTKVMVKPLRLTTYTASTVDTFGCKNAQSVTLDVWPSFILPSNLIKDTAICPGGVVSFDLKVNDKIVQWSPVVGMTAPSGPQVLLKPMATTEYTATVSDSGRCFVKSVSATVVVNPLPTLDMGADLVLPYNASFTLKPAYTGNIASYTWQPANELSCRTCPFPSGKATRQSFYTVDVVTDKGCISSGRILVSVECNANNIWMPTAFSPNSDGLNDTYYPLTRGIKEIKKFMIYNRFGELVFQRDNFQPNDQSLGWNGQFKGSVQPTGGFIYAVEAICDLGVVISKKGNFVIMK